MYTKFAASPQKNKAQSLVEFALALPLLLLMIFMIFDLGRAIYYFSAINHAAHEGARFGSVNYDVDQEVDIVNRVKSAAVGVGEGIDVDQEDICVCFDSLDRAHLHIQIEYIFEPATPFVASFLGSDGNVKLNSNSNIIIEFPIDKNNSSEYSVCTDIPGICVPYP